MSKTDTAKLEHKRELARIRKQNQRKRERDKQAVAGHAKAVTGSPLVVTPQIRATSPQGPMTPYFQDYIMRKVSGEFYEALREGIPIIDAAIRRLISLEGTIKIIGTKMDCVTELEDFCRAVPVNDVQKGIQAFQQNTSNEKFEQGFSVSEFVATPDLKDIEGLRVADSKDIRYRRNEGGKAEPWYRYPGSLPVWVYSNPESIVQRILTASYGQTAYITGAWETKLNPANLIYFSIDNENSDPYGVSLIRSMEFVSKILMTIQNSIMNVWQRFGDPSYKVLYKSSKAGAGGNLAARREEISADFETVVNAKRAGKSADFIYAIDKDSEISIEIIGAVNQELKADIPAKLVVEDLVGRSGLASWMLGRYWSMTERMATLEVEMALQDAKIRQLAMIPEFMRLFSTYLAIRGKKWKTVTTDPEKPGDWGFYFETPNVRDVMAMANARFLNAEASMLERGGTSSTATNVTVGGASFELPRKPKTILPQGREGREGKQVCGCGKSHPVTPSPRHAVKELNRPIPWPELDKVEKEYERELKHDWAELQDKVFSILGLKTPEKRSAPGVRSSGSDSQLRTPNSELSKAPFAFDDSERDMIMRALKTFLGYYDIDGPDSAVTWYYGQSYSVGLIQAANLAGKERPLLDILQNNEVYTELITNGFSLVRDSATRRIRNDIIMAMEDGMTQGVNPRDMAATLEGLFGDQNSDWERLARTEMAAAAERAKLDEWDARGIDISDAVTVPVHPRCRCSTTVKDDGNGNFIAVFLPAPDACPLCLSMQEGDKALKTELALLRQKGATLWYRSFDV